MVSFERARLYTMFKGVNGGQGKSKPFGRLDTKEPTVRFEDTKATEQK